MYIFLFIIKIKYAYAGLGAGRWENHRVFLLSLAVLCTGMRKLRKSKDGKNLFFVIPAWLLLLEMKHKIEE